ncbi:MAG: hypothetical protein A07HN63_00557 [uncultured archaeon A07HN63]|nr:MAG: hypothetical protein A07HN63_00557 [uncultured archaeon A07HN63]
MSLAAETREAVRERPALYDALRAGVVNYTAAAETLAIDGDREAIATALRRFAESLDAPDASDRSLTVRMDRRIDAESADSLPVLEWRRCRRRRRHSNGVADSDPCERRCR